MSVMQKLSEWYLEMDNDLNKLLEERDRLQAERDVAVKQAEQLQDDFAEAVENAARLQAQCEELRSDQKTLQEVWVAGRQRITELQAQLAATRKQLQEMVISHPDFGVERMPKKSKSESQLVQEIRNAVDQEEMPAGQNGLVRDVSHYIQAAEVDRPIEPQRQPEPQAEPVQVCEGRWKTRGGEVRDVTPTPDGDGRTKRWPWWDAHFKQTWRANGRYYFDGTGPLDLVEYLGRIEPPAEPQQPEQESKPYTFAAYIVGDKSQPDALRIVWATEEWIQHANFGIVHRMSDLKFFGNDTFTPDQFSVNLKVQ